MSGKIIKVDFRSGRRVEPEVEEPPELPDWLQTEDPTDLNKAVPVTPNISGSSPYQIYQIEGDLYTASFIQPQDAA